MVPVPGVKDGLLGVGGDHGGLVEGRHCVVGLPGAVLIQGLEVDCPPRRVVLFRDTDHPVTPGRRCPWWDLLNDADIHVSVQPGLNFFLPVNWDWNWGVCGHGLGTVLEENLQWRSVHFWKRLALAAVEG